MEEEIEDDKEKVFITRDSNDHFVWVWRKPTKGSWEPINILNNGKFNWQRPERNLEKSDLYNIDGFKMKFGFSIKEGEKICKKILINILNSEDFKIISNDPKRKTIFQLKQ